MAEDPNRLAPQSDDAGSDRRLDSWKEIAGYLNRDVTTVRRWEKREGLPVQRHLHDRRDSVYAYTGELDAWRKGRRNHLVENGAIEPDRGHQAGWRWAVAAIGVASALGFASGMLSSRPAPDDRAEFRFTISPPDQASIGAGALSPDGRHFAFSALTRDGRSQLWTRPLAALAATPLPGTEGASLPFWSPDGRALGFFAGGQLRTADIAGGATRIVCDAPTGRGGTWNADGVIVFAPGREGALYRVPAVGGAASPVTTVNAPNERGHLWPEFLPDGRHYLYLADSMQPEHHALMIGDLDGGTPSRLLSVDSSASYAPDGFLLYARDRRLVAQRFDPNRRQLSGEPLSLTLKIRQGADHDHKPDFSVSQNGILVFRNTTGIENVLEWRTRSGNRLGVLGPPALHAEPTLSPDDSRVAVSIFDPAPSAAGFGTGRWSSDIWMFSVADGTRERITFDPHADFEPAWSPDGARLVFSSNRRGSLDLYEKQASGAGREELLVESTSWKHAQTWSPDGRYVIYSSVEAQTKFDLWLRPMTGNPRPRPLLRNAYGESQAQVSPDGRWLAYTSTETGTYEVYVQDFPDLTGKWQVSAGGGGDPRWRDDGRELFYLDADGTLTAVPVNGGHTFSRGAARALFETGLDPHWTQARNHYDVSRDGGRFLVMSAVDDPWSAPFTAVVNWASSLREARTRSGDARPGPRRLPTP